MNKTGVVLEVKKNTAILLTSTGEFVKVAVSSKLPKVGETYTGILKKQSNYFKYLTAAIVLFIIFLSGGGAAYAYYTPVATVEVSINPSIELKLNRFHKVIKFSPINTDGENLLKNLQLKNKDIDEALILVVDQARKNNFINDSYIAQGKTISIQISTKKSTKIINLDKFQRYIVQNKINTNINNNGKENNQQFIKNDKNANKETLIDSNKKNDSNLLNKADNKNDKNINNNKAKPTEGGDEKVHNKNNNGNINNNNNSKGNNNSDNSNNKGEQESKGNGKDKTINIPNNIKHK